MFESLTGPEELAETSIMGFDPDVIIKGYTNKITIERKNENIEIIETNDPLSKLKDFIHNSADQSYRYLGGAVG
ncbi:MAG TPA: anthranilate synthase component I, partial [Nitrosopumilaceae archaeon]|nr:anthranilate synthase component I [Nitrosopumilaceae archaeon]